MIKKLKILSLFVLIMLQHAIFAQDLPPNVCKIVNGKQVFTIDLNWNDHQKQELRFTYSLDSMLIAKIFEGEKKIEIANTIWIAEVMGESKVSLSKYIENTDIPKDFLLDLIAEAIEGGSPAKSSNRNTEVKFGINDYKNNAISTNADNQTTFFLPNYKNADKVFISGSFNDWSTGQNPMQKTDSGWVFQTKLEPGKYFYKYIVDGNWTEDPNNKLKQTNEHGTLNSVMVVPNYVFRLKGYLNAKKAVLAGSFNNWNEKDFKMNKTKDGWELQAFLKKGTHTYKFIVDGRWIQDPENQKKTPDGHGAFNSVLEFGEKLKFQLNGYEDAKEVYLAGNFNNWKQKELLMHKTEQGWELYYCLSPGNYEYKFIADGKWITDPSNPMKVGSGDYTNSFITFFPNHVFKLEDYPQAQKVLLSGSFNGWNTNDYRMIKVGETWMFPIYLDKGKHTYKFIVDGEWITDPLNKQYEKNQFSTYNSVLWME